MPIFDLPAELIRNERITESIFLLSFHQDKIASAAQPGQFVMVQTGTGRDPLLRRPFSIHQITNDGKLQLLIRVLGSGTTQLSQLVPGESVKMLGPLGNSFDLSAIGVETDLIALVGGGMGVAPLLFLANRLAQLNLVGRTKIILGARFQQELLCLTAFKEMGYSTLCITDDGSSGQQGFVTELLQQTVLEHRRATVFSCGPTPMLKAVSSICRQYAIPCQVSMETYMACGISACLGCALPANIPHKKYVHVCKNGPVFQSQEIAWEQL